jgi:hypothetical protein
MNKTGVAMSYRAAHLDTDRPGYATDYYRWLLLFTVFLLSRFRMLSVH